MIAVALAIAACFAAVEFGVPRSQAAPIGSYTTRGAYSFVSAPSLHPPRIQLETVAATGAKALPGYVMLTRTSTT